MESRPFSSEPKGKTSPFGVLAAQQLLIIQGLLGNNTQV